MNFSSFEDARSKLGRSVKPLSEQRGQTMRILFFSGCVGIAFGGILISHVVYAWRVGAGVNTAELGGGIAFALFGLGLFLSGIYEAIIASAPRAEVHVTPRSPRLGQEMRFDWSITGRVSKLRRLRIELQGAETIDKDVKQSLHRPSWRDVAKSDVFATIPIVDEQAPLKTKGSARVRMPSDARPSSVSPEGNRVVDWGIHIVGERTSGLTFEDDYPVTIRPAN